MTKRSLETPKIKSPRNLPDNGTEVYTVVTKPRESKSDKVRKDISSKIQRVFQERENVLQMDDLYSAMNRLEEIQDELRQQWIRKLKNRFEKTKTIIEKFRKEKECLDWEKINFTILNADFMELMAILQEEAEDGKKYYVTDYNEFEERLKSQVILMEHSELLDMIQGKDHCASVIESRIFNGPS